MRGESHESHALHARGCLGGGVVLEIESGQARAFSLTVVVAARIGRGEVSDIAPGWHDAGV